MLERLQQLGSDAEAARLSRGAKQRRETSPRTVGEPVQRAQDETAGAGSSEQDMSTSAAESSQKANRVQATPNAEEPKSRVVRGSAFWGFPFVRTVLRLVELVMIRLSVTSSSGGIGTRSRLPENKEPILRGAFAAIIVYAILRKREFLRRWNSCFSFNFDRFLLRKIHRPFAPSDELNCTCFRLEWGY